MKNIILTDLNSKSKILRDLNINKLVRISKVFKDAIIKKKSFFSFFNNFLRIVISIVHEYIIYKLFSFKIKKL